MAHIRNYFEQYIISYLDLSNKLIKILIYDNRYVLDYGKTYLGDEILQMSNVSRSNT